MWYEGDFNDYEGALIHTESEPPCYGDFNEEEEVETIQKKVVVVPYSTTTAGGRIFGEPRRETVTVRFTSSAWFEIDGQQILEFVNIDYGTCDYIRTSQCYFFVMN